MKFIRTREHERTTKKHTQPTLPAALRKKLLAASRKQSEQAPEDWNEYAVDQVEVAAVQLTEQAVHTTAKVAQAVQPIIREKIVQTGIKERPGNAETIHHTKEAPDSDHSAEAVPLEARQQFVEQKTTTETKRVTSPAEPNTTHYGQSKVMLSEQPSRHPLQSPKEKPSGGSTVPKTKPTAAQKAAQQHSATPITQPKPTKTFFKRQLPQQPRP